MMGGKGTCLTVSPYLFFSSAYCQTGRISSWKFVSSQPSQPKKNIVCKENVRFQAPSTIFQSWEILVFFTNISPPHTHSPSHFPTLFHPFSVSYPLHFLSLYLYFHTPFSTITLWALLKLITLEKTSPTLRYNILPSWRRTLKIPLKIPEKHRRNYQGKK